MAASLFGGPIQDRQALRKTSGTTRSTALPPLWRGWSGLRLIALTCADYTAGRKIGFSARARARAGALDRVLRKSGNSAFRGLSAQREGPETRILTTGFNLEGKPAHAVN